MSVALIFSGQGAQAVGMGKSLAANSAAARELFAQADEAFGESLSTLCFEGPQEALTPTRICQPALYVHGLAVVAALRELGKLPEVKAAAGLSLGELTALQFAGVYDFATGLKIVAERGRLMQEACDASAGGMASLIGGTPEAAVELAQKHDLDVANFNCPGQIVLSGDKARVQSAAAEAKEAGFKMALPLDVAGAYHSRLMQPAADSFAAFLAELEFQEPSLAVFTNVTGQQVTSTQEIKEMLVRQVTSSVRWEDCFRAAQGLGVEGFYECGTGNVLAGLAKRIDRSASVKTLNEWDHLQAL